MSRAQTSRAAVPQAEGVLRGRGTPLDRATRAYFEPRFGHDFSNVRVHHDAAAAASVHGVHARAYTVGPHIVLGRGEHSREVLAHELAHTIQHRGAHASGPIAIGSPGDPAERHADSAARAALHGRVQPPMQTFAPALRRLMAPAAAAAAQAASAVEDPDRMRISAVDDVLIGKLKTRKVVVMLKEPSAASVELAILDPGGARMSSVQRKTIDPADRMAPDSYRLTDPTSPGMDVDFELTKAQFSGSFQPGQYHLVSTAYDEQGTPLRVARRDFNVLGSDLKTGASSAGTYGSMRFAEYRLMDAKDPDRDASLQFQLKVTLVFLPKHSVMCGDIAMIQTAQNLRPDGSVRSIDPAREERGTKAGWHIDQHADNLSPYYISQTDAKTGISADRARFGKAGSGWKKREAAILDDTPGSSLEGTRRFETCAICRSGGNKGQYYGCATWGYRADAAGRVTFFPRAFNDVPTREFLDATKQWNVWREEPSWTDEDRPHAAPELKAP